jgi:hypothetical protein
MSSLQSILSPEIEDPKPSPEVEERPAKRRKSTTPPRTNPSLSPKPLSSPKQEIVRIPVKDERKAKWLAGLSHEELLGVAQGAVWQGT